MNTPIPHENLGVLPAMPLTASSAKAAAPKDKDYKLSDEKGLFLLVRKNGGKYWRMKYRHQGKEKLLALGVFPEVTLAQARVQREEARAIRATLPRTDIGIAPRHGCWAKSVSGYPGAEVAFKNRFSSTDRAKEGLLRRSR